MTIKVTPVESALNSALAKTGMPITDQDHSMLLEFQTIFSFKLGSHKVYAEHRNTIQDLTTAISKLRTVQLKYYSASQRRLTRRKIEPYELLFTNSALYLVGYCRLRKDVRMFAVERIRSLTFTDHPYQIPLGFTIQDYTNRSIKRLCTLRRGVNPAIRAKLNPSEIWSGSVSEFMT